MKVGVPPIKSQGIKTKLVPFIAASISWNGEGRWIEPFLGSGVVALNMRPNRALLADANPHLISVYRDIQSGELTAALLTDHLRFEGERLLMRGEEHYYEVRERFNDAPSSKDFLFLNRSCFNGVIRFNKKGRFNVPFCKKPDRFRQAYVTKITNQVRWAREVISAGDFEFKVQDWRQTLKEASDGDFVYLDPPYNGRHADYYSQWEDIEDDSLAQAIVSRRGGFALSTWLENKYRKNEYVSKWFSDFPTVTQSHFYHVGSSEDLRNEMTEALVIQRGYTAGKTRGMLPMEALNLFSTL
jgi:DNA adenine methylase